jgi:hypothetical protein
VILPAVALAMFEKYFLMCITYLKNMSEEKQRRLDFSKCYDLTAEACCVSKLTISCICRDAKW